MSYYDLNRLGSERFEHLVQALIKPVIGNGTITFGQGRDGGREATFEGAANAYPSRKRPWDGKWIFQAKFHDLSGLDLSKARHTVIRELEDELAKQVNKYGRHIDNYILATNVPLSSVDKSGTHDKISLQVAPKFPTIRNIHVWGGDEIGQFLNNNQDVRFSFLEAITPGDILAEIMANAKRSRNRVAKGFHAYLHACYRQDAPAQLDQAGEVDENPIDLEHIFIDTSSKLYSKGISQFDLISWQRQIESHSRPDAQHDELIVGSTLSILCDERIGRMVLIGGPGQGKSTLGQYLAQLHRSILLKDYRSFSGDKGRIIVPRLPFRIQLKDFAQWLTGEDSFSTIEHYLIKEIEEAAAFRVSLDDLHEYLAENPSVIILDGLDEVTDSDARTKTLQAISTFLSRCAEIYEANIKVVATSRPTSYVDDFPSEKFLHLELVELSRKQVMHYVNSWIAVKEMEKVAASRLRDTVDSCLDDLQIRVLTSTPLQVTIIILIIVLGGTPPRQREGLFNQYLEIIYRRERAKSTSLVLTDAQLMFGLHNYIGYLLHRNSSQIDHVDSYLKKEEYRREIFNFLQHMDPYKAADELKSIARRMSTEVGQRLVLLVELKTNLWGFELRSLQEFFAAAHLVDSSQNSNERMMRFESISVHPHWRNVALFFAGRVGRIHPGEGGLILEVCRQVDQDGPDRILRRGARLAIELAVDRAFGANRRLQSSALDFGISSLDSDYPTSAFSAEITKNISELPDEDIEQIVVPIIRKRILRADIEGKVNLSTLLVGLRPRELTDGSYLVEAFESRERRRAEIVDTLIKSAVAPHIISGLIEEAVSDEENQSSGYYLPIGLCLYLDPDRAIQILAGITNLELFAADLCSNVIRRPMYGRLSDRLDMPAENCSKLLKKAKSYNNEIFLVVAVRILSDRLQSAERRFRRGGRSSKHLLESRVVDYFDETFALLSLPSLGQIPVDKFFGLGGSDSGRMLAILAWIIRLRYAQSISDAEADMFSNLVKSLSKRELMTFRVIARSTLDKNIVEFHDHENLSIYFSSFGGRDGRTRLNNLSIQVDREIESPIHPLVGAFWREFEEIDQSVGAHVEMVRRFFGPIADLYLDLEFGEVIRTGGRFDLPRGVDFAAIFKSVESDISTIVHSKMVPSFWSAHSISNKLTILRWVLECDVLYELLENLLNLAWISRNDRFQLIWRFQSILGYCLSGDTGPSTAEFILHNSDRIAELLKIPVGMRIYDFSAPPEWVRGVKRSVDLLSAHPHVKSAGSLLYALCSGTDGRYSEDVHLASLQPNMRIESQLRSEVRESGMGALAYASVVGFMDTDSVRSACDLVSMSRSHSDRNLVRSAILAGADRDSTTGHLWIEAVLRLLEEYEGDDSRAEIVVELISALEVMVGGSAAGVEIRESELGLPLHEEDGSDW